MRQQQSLNGLWEYRVPEGVWQPRQVPGSYYCVGEAQYRRTFTWNKTDRTRVLLCFEGILYEGKLEVNGTPVAAMLPYSQYKVDITDVVRNGENEIVLSLQDITAEYGPTLGWSSYGGIAREVYLEETAGPVYVDTVHWRTSFTDAYAQAACTVTVALAGAVQPAVVTAALTRKGLPVAMATQEAVDGEATLTFAVEQPMLWSPDAPELYDLQVTAQTEGGSDTICQTVGFKDFRVEGNTFTLNGQRIFLAGVCRHDLWEEPYNFTQTDAQVEQDMRLIKQMGANFVRLVHYPHDKRVVAWADRLGLLVSGEPGFWGVDFDKPTGTLVDKGVRVLEKLVTRDRNNVSVAFWLTFNECSVNDDFLRTTREAVRRLDPDRPVSGANYMNAEFTREHFSACGYDFYTFHPYGPLPSQVTGGADPGQKWTKPWQSLEELASFLNDKPLVLTEWGGYYVHDNPSLFTQFCEQMFRMGQNKAPDPVLAGMSYWCWSDIHEANRDRPSSVDGYQREGLVDMERRLRVNYDTLAHAIARAATKMNDTTPPRVQIYGTGRADGVYVPVKLDRTLPGQDAAWEDCLRRLREENVSVPRKKRKADVGPALPEAIALLGDLPVDLPAGRPVVVSQVSGPVCLPVEQDACRLTVIGQASMPYGYPADGAPGDRVGTYVLRYADGTEQTIPLRNGREVVTVHVLLNASRIEPAAACLHKAVVFSYDPSYEVYQINRLDIPVRKDSRLESLTVTVTDERYALLLYGLTVEK